MEMKEGQCDLEVSVAFTELYNKVKNMILQWFGNIDKALMEQKTYEYIEALAKARQTEELKKVLNKRSES